MSEGKGWTLISRVSNNDGGKWGPLTKGGREWWLHYGEAQNGEGTTTDPSQNKDMVSRAFTLVSGTEFMITRSDYPHTALLRTTNDCLGGQTFRDKIRRSYYYGGFKDNQCRSSCSVTYGGLYTQTEGFEQVNNNRCSMDSFHLQSGIGFWCFHAADEYENGAVMMIGAGGVNCSGADHGIGVFEMKLGTNFIKKTGDFGNKVSKVGESPTKSYSLNLWVR